MRLSFIVELLLVFLFLAFAAARVIDTKDARVGKAKKGQKRQGPPNRYCACTSNMCNCCRDFSLPVVPLKGPGCASLTYLKDDQMAVSMTFGDRVLANTVISGRKPKPVCMGLPGGISQFCGRVYGISRSGEEFKACLGLELRALDDIEAALRVSCFKFGPKGVNLEPAPPIPSDEKDKEDEDDDDDDDYGLEDDDDDDDDDEDDDDVLGLVDDDDDEDENTSAAGGEGNEVDSDDSADYTGFSVLGEDIFGGLFSDDDSPPKKKKKNKTAKPAKIGTTTRKPLLPTKKPIFNRVTKKPLNRITRPTKPTKVVPKPGAPTPGVVAPAPVPTTNAATSTTSTTTTSTTPASLKSTETAPVTTTVSTPTLSTATMSPTVAPTVIVGSPPSDLSIPMIDVAKVEAVAAIAQQDVSSPVMVNPTTTAPISNVQAVAEMVKGNLPVNPVDDDVDDEDDLFDGMIHEVASIAGGSEKSKPSKKKPATEVKKTDNTKKGNLPGSSVNAKPAKKPVDDDDEIDFLSGVIGDDSDDDDDEENDDDDDDDDEEEDDEEDDEDDDESEENNEVNKPTNSNDSTKAEDDDDDDDDDDDVGLNLFESVIGSGIKEVTGQKDPEKDANSNETDDDDDEEEDDDDDLLSGVVGGSDDDDDDDDEEDDNDDDKKPVNNVTKKTTVKDEEEDDDEDDLLSVLDGDDDDDNTSEEVQASTTTSAPEESKPEANLVDSNEVKAPMDDVTDYDEEKPLEVTTMKQETSTEAVKAEEEEEEDDDDGEEEDGSEKAAASIANDEDEEDSETADVEIEGDIGLGADDEDRQIKKIRQIVGEAKAGRAPHNWSIFLRPARRFGDIPESSMRGRSERVHRRMNLDRLSS